MKQLSITAVFLFAVFTSLNAQNQSTAYGCQQHFSTSFISDGQQYMSLLTGNDAAEFKILFFENTTYRIATCSNTPGVELEYNVYDTERNLLFSSKDHENNPYWNFQFEHTIECYIEARIAEGGPDSGIAMLLIGFKKN